MAKGPRTTHLPLRTLSPYSTLLYSTLLYSTLLYFTLLYSTPGLPLPGCGQVRKRCFRRRLLVALAARRPRLRPHCCCCCRRRPLGQPLQRLAHAVCGVYEFVVCCASTAHALAAAAPRQRMPCVWSSWGVCVWSSWGSAAGLGHGVRGEMCVCNVMCMWAV